MADKGGPDGICLAFGSGPYALNPTWTRIDDPDVPPFAYKASSPHNTNCVSEWSVDRGRSYELDKTQTGTATITVQDPNGLFDPTNANSPYYGLIGPMTRASISLYDPNNKAYTLVFTGFVESWNWTITTEEKLEITTINLVDGFEPLTRVELTPDITGVTVVPGDSGVAACQDRLTDFLNGRYSSTFGSWPDDGLFGPMSRWRNINTGNVYLQQVIYNPQTSLLSAMQDVADAEFPGVANIFINKAGAVTFYGRYPRFQPTNFPNDVTIWRVGDAGGVGAFGGAAIAVIEWDLDQSLLYNAVLCYPQLCPQADIIFQLYTDSTSAASYGYRSLTLQDLVVAGQPGNASQPAIPFTGSPGISSANSVCLAYAQYYVVNYKSPQLRISRLEFHTRPASDADSWAFLCGVEIGDIVSVFTSGPGGGGFGKETDALTPAEFFVEGVHYQVQANQLGLPDITLTLDVSPRAWFTTPSWTGPYFTLSENSGNVSDVVAVSGFNFTASSTITVHEWDGANIALTPGTPSTDTHGNWTATFVVPSATANTLHTLLFSDAAGETSSGGFWVA